MYIFKAFKIISLRWRLLTLKRVFKRMVLQLRWRNPEERTFRGSLSLIFRTIDWNVGFIKRERNKGS